MKTGFTLLVCFGLAVVSGLADDRAEAIIPSTYSVSRYSQSWSKNPFLLRSTPEVQPRYSFSRDWALQGMANYDGKVQVTIVNTKTGEYRHLTNQEAANAEFHLIHANFSRNRADAFAEIRKGDERAVIKYSERR